MHSHGTARRFAGTASVVEVQALVDERKNEFVAFVTEEFATMKPELAKEFSAELRDFVQQETAKSSNAFDAKRKPPKLSDDMEADGGGSPVADSSSGGHRRVSLRPPVPRSAPRSPAGISGIPGRLHSSCRLCVRHPQRLAGDAASRCGTGHKLLAA